MTAVFLYHSGNPEDMLFFWLGIIALVIFIFALKFLAQLVKGIAQVIKEIFQSKEIRYILVVAVIIFWIIVIAKNSH